MKNIILLFSLVLLSASTFAFTSIPGDTIIIQERKVVAGYSDTTMIRVGNKVLEVIETPDGRSEIIFNSKKRFTRRNKNNERFFGHWQGAELGVNMLMDDNLNLLDNDNWDVQIPRSLELNLNLVQTEFQVSPRAGFIVGLGLTYNDYHFSNRVTLDKDDAGNLVFLHLDRELYPGFKKSKFSVGYLNIPLLFEVQSNNRNQYLSFGLESGLKIGTHTKIKSKNGKEKDHGDFNVNTFRFAGVVRIGIGDIKLFAKYNINSLFENKTNLAIHPFSVGFSFN